MTRIAVWGVAAALAVNGVVAGAPTASLKPISSEMLGKYRGLVTPQYQDLLSAPPPMVKTPPDVSGLLWGSLAVGPNSSAVTFSFAIDERDPQNARIYVDANGDGDMTNDPEVTWPLLPALSGNLAVNCHQASIRIPAGHERRGERLVTLYRFGPLDAKARRIPENRLFYYADAITEGTFSIDGKSYRVLLVDTLSKGDFTYPAGRSNRLLFQIDLNGDGEFLSAEESNNVGQPFQVGKKVYEVEQISADGTTITIRESTRTPPPAPGSGSARVGSLDSAPPFSGPDLDGKPIKFPDDYRGKIVLIDFWATWCGPCVREIPNLVEVYKEFNGKGFEILGVTLDRAGQADRVKKFAVEREMPWKQLYEGKQWDCKVSQQWRVNSIPQMFLVDGDTGKILANGRLLRGGGLKDQVKRALAGKGKG